MITFSRRFNIEDVDVRLGSKQPKILMIGYYLHFNNLVSKYNNYADIITQGVSLSYQTN